MISFFDNCIISYETGSSEKNGNDPIIFISGFFMDHYCFTKQIDTYKEHHKIVCITIVDSSSFVIDNDLCEYAERILHFIENRGIKRFIIWGHSLGAHIARKICELSPDNISGCVLVAMNSIHSIPPINIVCQKTCRHLLEQGIRNDALEIMSKLFLAKKNNNTRLLKNSLFIRTMLKAFQLVNNDEYINYSLYDNRFPILIFHGSCDAGNLIRKTKEFSHRVSSSKLVIINGGSHAMHVTHEIEFNGLVDFWLQSVKLTPIKGIDVFIDR